MWCRFVCGMSVVLVLFAPFEISEVHAQAPGKQSAKAAPNEAPASPAEIELVKRIEAARTARNSGDPAAVAQLAASLPDIADDDLRQALARLGVAVKRG